MSVGELVLLALRTHITSVNACFVTKLITFSIIWLKLLEFLINNVQYLPEVIFKISTSLLFSSSLLLSVCRLYTFHSMFSNWYKIEALKAFGNYISDYCIMPTLSWKFTWFLFLWKWNFKYLLKKHIFHTTPSPVRV